MLNNFYKIKYQKHGQNVKILLLDTYNNGQADNISS